MNAASNTHVLNHIARLTAVSFGESAFDGPDGSFNDELNFWREAFVDEAERPLLIAAWSQVVRNDVASGAMPVHSALVSCMAVYEIGSERAREAVRDVLQDIANGGVDEAALVYCKLVMTSMPSASLVAEALGLLSVLAAREDRPLLQAHARCVQADAMRAGLGIPRDPMNALRLYMLAADEGVGAACYHLGVFYQGGTPGWEAVHHNVDIAGFYYQQGMDLGSGRCMQAWGRLHLEGRLLDSDPLLGAEMLEMASHYQSPEIVADPAEQHGPVTASAARAEHEQREVRDSQPAPIPLWAMRSASGAGARFANAV